MEYVYSLLMAIFAAAILLYAGLLALTKDYTMLPYQVRHSVKKTDAARYLPQLAKAIALAALAPALSALAGLWNAAAGLIVLVAALIVFLWLGTKIMKNAK